MVYGALMSIEVGKNRIESLGEVEESADLLRYYTQTAIDNRFYEQPMGNLGDRATHTRSVLRPHGVFGVIAPFNFPMALAAGPTAAALLAGNTCVFKPASAGAMSAVLLMEAYRDAGVPAGVINLVMGPGSVVGDELVESEAIDGIVFTGSYEVGMGLQRAFTKAYPRPCIVEMGGKNPAIVMASADLDEAAEGILRSAFGFGGQKCSANSRVYVERSVHDELVRLLVEKTEAITIGDPLGRATWLGPLTDQAAVERFERAVAEARRDGRVFCGGERLAEGDLGARLLRGADGRGRPAGRASSLPRRALRALHGGPRRGFAGRGAAPLQRRRLRPHGRHLQRRRGPRWSASWRASRRASCTSTGGPAPPPAPGRACSRSAAGRARAPPARPPWVPGTWPSSCASRATPSSTSPGGTTTGIVRAFRAAGLYWSMQTA